MRGGVEAKYDVCKWGGVEKIRQMQTRGGEGVKKPENFVDII